jgi:alpha,alpha-trehalase
MGPCLGSVRRRASLSGTPESPFVKFSELYQAVETASSSRDQKTFADAIPGKPTAQLATDYEQQKRQPGFNLKASVLRHYALRVWLRKTRLD